MDRESRHCLVSIAHRTGNSDFIRRVVLEGQRIGAGLRHFNCFADPSAGGGKIVEGAIRIDQSHVQFCGRGGVGGINGDGFSRGHGKAAGGL